MSFTIFAGARRVPADAKRWAARGQNRSQEFKIMEGALNVVRDA